MENIFSAKLINDLNASCSQFHVVKNLERELLRANFKEIGENEKWELLREGKYFIKRNDSSLIAFSLPETISDISFKIVATHTDSPTFKIKPNAFSKEENATVLEIEPYGSPIFASWVDRPLSIAGRIIYSEENKINSTLVNIDRDLLIIPSLAIHLNRETNKGVAYNPSKDLRPLIGINLPNEYSLLDLLKKEIGENKEIISYDLYLYNRSKASTLGVNEELISSPRLDDLASTYSSLYGFINSVNQEQISILACFDNEEVGSLTRQGANSTFLKDTLYRIAKEMGFAIDFEKIIAKSMLISIDNAHAIHPNYLEMSAKNNKVLLNEGIVIKYNANQSYTTDGLSSALVKSICKKYALPYQEYTNRSDLKGGSTLGNISNSEISLLSADIGLPQLSMHSSYETMGKDDVLTMVNFVKNYFNETIVLDGTAFYLRK